LKLGDRGEDGKTVLQEVQAACQEKTCSTPTKEMLAFLEQVDKK